MLNRHGNHWENSVKRAVVTDTKALLAQMEYASVDGALCDDCQQQIWGMRHSPTGPWLCYVCQLYMKTVPVVPPHPKPQPRAHILQDSKTRATSTRKNDPTKKTAMIEQRIEPGVLESQKRRRQELDENTKAAARMRAKTIEALMGR